MNIYENTMGAKKTQGVILEMGTNEAALIYEALKEYCINNKRKKIAKALLKQMYNEMPIGL